MKRTIKILLWLLALILTLTIAVYQRLTGPTHPVRGSEDIKGNKIKYKLLRSYTANKNLPVTVQVENFDGQGSVLYKRYNIDEPWTEISMVTDEKKLEAHLPGQPIAGKIEYKVKLVIGNENFFLKSAEAIVARFKGEVPAIFLILHVLAMFMGILFAIRTGLECLTKKGNYIWMVNITLLLLILGGLVLGPIVQKYAFGDFWTGFPFGTDLTDNKVLLLVIVWILAYIFKRRSRWIVFASVVIMMIIYIIPHSIYGSELDYKTGKMKNKYSYLQIESTPFPISGKLD